MKIIINPKYIAQEKAILQLVNSFFSEGELIVEGSRNTIKSNVLGNEKVNIKFFQKPGLFKSIIYSFFRSTKAKRSYDYANYLLNHNIPTPLPIAYIEEQGPLGLLGKSYYISEQIDYDFTIRELIHDPLFPERDIILEQFTEFTYKMHQAQVNFLDHSPGNTLIVNKGGANYDFYLIDLNRMKFEELSMEQRMDNFKKMWLSKQMIKVVAKKYAALSNQPMDKIYPILMEKSISFKRKINKKKYLKRKIGRKA
ncbi:lipopolysaccharide kinase InaA family protein [Flavobacterium sp. SUN046]|uniref:lipopolysaccharide kinase InaA family protein n=1 Tax=Flavobacterium sp. SUN046 TaxID=3002440 RepID=UPI002DBBE341|nr:lipopolysaccharide kinase InaA family protein [Flavobacterium sp. SUN046]MEC4049797.1 lipopolysaccharide kinase InaA family protein [Flavobacterium sp. SUN046]